MSSNGLSTLPDELLLEIVSHFPPDIASLSNPSPTQITRREMLHSLSEVCQSLRHVFRPCLWQRIEVYAGLRAGMQILSHRRFARRYGGTRPKPKKSFVKELLRQLDVVTIQDPGLAQHVRVVDIEINDAYLRKVFAELGRCFSLFPNLHTVKIITRFTGYYFDPVQSTIDAVKRGFKRSILYPQIRSTILSDPIFPFLVVCPNLESLATSRESPLLLGYIRGLKALQKLSCPLSPTSATAIASDLPLLQQITIADWRPPSYSTTNEFRKNAMNTVRLFKNLRTLIVPHYFTAGGVSNLKQAILDISPHDRQNLREVVYACHGQEDISIIPPF